MSRAFTSADADTVWCGPIYEPTGYADEGRGLLRALEEAGVEVALRPAGVPREGFAESLPTGERQLLERLAGRRPARGFVLVQHFPADGLVQLPAVVNVGRTMFESDGLPTAYVRRANEMDELWVPSVFNRETFRAAGVAAPIEIVPGGVDAQRFHPEVAPLPLADGTSTVFLGVFEWRHRKGWDVLLRAWATAFAPDDDVRLLLRSAAPRPRRGALGEVGAELPRPSLDTVIDRFLATTLDRTRRDVAPIRVLPDPVPDAQLPALYTAADVLVAPSRGEGWGRPLMEAMAAGRPVIATAWSAPLDFVADDYAYLLGIDGLVEAFDAEIPIYRGQRWAEPSVTHLAELMRRAHADAAERRLLGARARAAMVADWPWSRAADAMSAHLRRLRGRPVFPASPASASPTRSDPAREIHLDAVESLPVDVEAWLAAFAAAEPSLRIGIPSSPARRPARWSDSVTWWQRTAPSDTLDQAAARAAHRGPPLLIWRRTDPAPRWWPSARGAPVIVVADALPATLDDRSAACLRDAAAVWVAQPACVARAVAAGVDPERIWCRPLTAPRDGRTLRATGVMTRHGDALHCVLPVLAPEAIAAADPLVRTWLRAFAARRDLHLRVLVPDHDAALTRWRDAITDAVLRARPDAAHDDDRDATRVEIMAHDVDDAMLPTWLDAADVLVECDATAHAPSLWSAAAHRGLPIVASRTPTGWPLPDALLTLVDRTPNGRIAWPSFARTLDRLGDEHARATASEALRTAAAALPDAHAMIRTMRDRLAALARDHGTFAAAS